MVASDPKGVIMGPALEPMSAASTVPVWACAPKRTLRAISAAGRLLTMFEAKAVAPAAARSICGDPGLISASFREEAPTMPDFQALHGNEKPMTNGISPMLFRARIEFVRAHSPCRQAAAQRWPPRQTRRVQAQAAEPESTNEDGSKDTDANEKVGAIWNHASRSGNDSVRKYWADRGESASAEWRMW